MQEFEKPRILKLMNDSPTSRALREKLAASGALLFSVGLVTGFWSAAALTGMVQVEMPRLALAAHLNGLFGGLWLLAVAFTLEYLAYSEKQKKILSFLVIIPSWANWGVTLIASFWGVNGLSFTSDLHNNLIAVLLQLFVVLPSVIAGIYWVRGFYLRKTI